MRSFAKVFFLSLFITTSFSQTSKDAVFGINKILIEHHLLKKDNKVFENFLEAFKEQIEAENKINGTLGFGLILQNSQNQDLSQFKVSAQVNKGFFPGEFRFNSEINVQVRDGQFIENLSNLSMSYDHHFGDNLSYEGYTFLRRTSNNFLNIDQRYETGAGLIWNIILSGKNISKEEDKLSDRNQQSDIEKLRKNRLTERGVEKLKAIRGYKPKDGKALSEKSKEEELELCIDGICLPEGILLVDKERKAIKKELKRSIRSILKQESKVRASILAGLNYETERTTDSLQLIFRDDITQKQTFSPINLVRAVIAPGLQLKIDKLELTSRCYFKLAISDDDLESVVVDNLLEDSKTDYRLEWQNKASLTLSEKIKITAVLNYTKINAPRRGFFVVENEGSNQLFSAANRFINFNIGLEYKL